MEQAIPAEEKPNYIEQPVVIVTNIIRDLFMKNRYPRTVKIDLKRVGGDAGWESYVVEMKNNRAWIRYELKIKAYPPTTLHYPDYVVNIKVTLVNTFDLYVNRSEIALKLKEFSCRQSMLGYFVRRNLSETVLYWQALVQMKWVDVSLFTLMRHRVSRLLRKLGMNTRT